MSMVFAMSVEEPRSHPPAQEQQLIAYYATEVRKNIENLAGALSEIDGQTAFLEKINVIINALQCIKDLAMIHGYEGVEAIAERMENGARHYLSQGLDSPELFRAKMNQALDVLRRMVDMVDDRETQRLVRETAHAMDYEIDSLNVDLHEGKADIDQQQDGIPEITDEPVKDDDDDNKLQTQTPASEMWSALEDEFLGICEPELSVPEVVAGDEYSGHAAELKVEPLISRAGGTEEQVEYAFDEILATKVTEHLDRLAAAVQRIHENENRALAVQEVRDICMALKILSEQVGHAAFNQLVFPLERLVRECLHPEDGSAEVVAAVAHAEQLLRSYLISPDKNPAELLSMKDQVERFFSEEHLTITSEAAATFAEPPDDDEDVFGDDEQYPRPPKPPMIIRLRRLFGMG